MIVGTAGHVDHGKTTLVRLLTGVDTDRLAEEKARGMTIDLGFAYKRLASGRTLAFVDVPGHERFVRNMLAGSAGIDCFLLAVAADDGTMPQTREHVEILSLLGVRQGVVAITKADLASTERIAAVGESVRHLLAGTCLAGAPILPVSARAGEGLDALERALADAAATQSRRCVDGHFRLAVDRSFHLQGLGTVVTGTVFSGSVTTGESLVVSPCGLRVKVRSLHVQNGAASRAVAGDRCAVNLVGPGVSKDAVHRGDWIVAEAVHAPTERLDAQMQVLSTAPDDIRHWTSVHAHIGATDVTGRLSLLDGRSLARGALGPVQLILDRPACALKGDRFVIRDQSARKTLGGGVVLDPYPPRRGRRTPERLAYLAAVPTAMPGDALRLLADLASAGADVLTFQQAWNLSSAATQGLRQDPELRFIEAGSRVLAYSVPRWIRLRAAILEQLRDYHLRSPERTGATLGDLRRAPGVTSMELLHVLLNELTSAGDIVVRNGRFALPHHTPEVPRALQRLWERALPVLMDAGFTPLRSEELMTHLSASRTEVEAVLRLGEVDGKIARITRTHYLLQSAAGRLEEVIRGLAPPGSDRSFSIADFRARTQVGRNHAVALLEFFDRRGLTLRVGDGRVVRRCRAGSDPAPGPVQP